MSARPARISTDGGQPERWTWPALPRTFKVFDKYIDEERSLSSSANAWRFTSGGRPRQFTFAVGAEGRLQRTLTIHTQGKNGPAALEKFLLSLLSNWSLYRMLLVQGPGETRRIWDESVRGINAANAGKSILTLACNSAVGPWRPLHLPLVKALDSRGNAYRRRCEAQIIKRARNLGADSQGSVVRLLDQAASLSDPPARDLLEGIVALALAFQHGVRPVQMIALRTEHVRVLRDCDDRPVVLVSFHKAKQGDDRPIEELVRQVKPEWSRLAAWLYDEAVAEGRTRLFASRSRAALWDAAKRAAKAFRVNLDFTLYNLRHTAAQSLADAGHSRESIQRFLGHSKSVSASKYVIASRKQVNLINTALGASKLYEGLLGIAKGRFVSIEELLAATQDKQIGGVVGDRLIGGLGICKTGQASCPYDPVSSCYGCDRYMPTIDRAVHVEAIVGMREQVIKFAKLGRTESPAYLQLRSSLAVGQRILEAIDNMPRSAHGNEDART